MGLGKTFKKLTKNPLAVVAPAIGIGNQLLGAKNSKAPYEDPGADLGRLNALAAEEEAKRKALGLQQQGQINTFADEQQKRAAEYRQSLARSLADTSAQTFKRMNPMILEDLNARGLFTSPTARDQEQSLVLGDLAREQANQLSAFDTDTFNQINDIRGSGLEALLGGDQSALDSALSLKKSGLTRSFDVADTNREQSFANQLAKRQSRDQLISALLGAGGRIASSRGAG